VFVLIFLGDEEMKRSIRLCMSIAMIGLLSCSTYSADDDRIDSERKTEIRQVQSSGRGVLKTLMMGALMLSSPLAVEAPNSGFVGCYMGTVNDPSQSDNVSINTLSITNWNYYATISGFKFYPNAVSYSPYKIYYTQFSFNTECDKVSYCKYLYIKTAKLCEKMFDVNYYASIIYGAPYVNSFYLAVSDSLSSNNTEFDKTFSGYMTKGNCSTPTPTSVVPHNPNFGA
jgi:hypothetical protein